MISLDLTDDELAITIQALDVHRQMLSRKLRERKLDDRALEKTLFDKQLCSSASVKLQDEQDTRIVS